MNAIQARVCSAAVCSFAILWLSASSLPAQELEPRTFANTPVGVNFLAVGYGLSTGNVVMDPALPIEGLEADVHVLFSRYTRSLALFGRSSKLKVIVPYSSGDWEGDLEGEHRTRSDSGLGDARFALEVNFLGAPALSRSEFRDYRQSTILGASLQIVAPTGQYDSSKLINLGSNRWVFKPEIGGSWALSKWTLEVAGSAWLFTDNTDFLNGSKLTQRPLYVAKAHAIRMIRPGFWLAAGIGFGEGGRTSVDGIARQTLQRNWRFGLTLSIPVTANQGVSLGLGSGVTSRAGGDFDRVSVAYQYSWGGG
jgi:hypothetical protein